MRPMPIIRSRTGCFTCRRRKKKCNEEKPICSGCKRNRLECHWPTEGNSTLQVRSKPGAPVSVNPPATTSGPTSGTAAASSSSSAGPRRQASVAASSSSHQPLDLDTESSITVQPFSTSPQRVAHSRSSSSPTSNASPGLDAEMAEADDEAEAPSPSTSSSSASSGSHDPSAQGRLPVYNADTADGLALTLNSNIYPDSDPAKAGVSMPVSLLPQHGHHSYELLGYYLARTANSMGNGSTEVNPFVAKLIPLAFSQPLVLQLILAQSAVHRQASEERLPTDEVATRYYADSLRMFRNVVGEYVSGNDDNTLVLTVGSLILCLTEVAKGDINGTIFDHFTASKSLLQMLLSRPKSQILGDLPDFLVEYYMHIAASSIISIDPQYNSQPVLSPEIETLARGLVDKKYVGQLCGCWLELLVLIPQIFQLGQSIMAGADGEKGTPSPDNIITFGFIQSQIMAFFPGPLVNPNTQLAGLVFKQAVLLYLWTILGTPQTQSDSSAHKNLMDGAVAEAVSLLSQFPATIRINTSLCWPLAVIGCCTSDPTIQQFLRSRLQTTFDAIGLGNMRQTLVLLEHVWRQPVEDTSPWTLCKSMREHQIWISFA